MWPSHFLPFVPTCFNIEKDCSPYLIQPKCSLEQRWIPIRSWASRLCLQRAVMAFGGGKGRGGRKEKSFPAVHHSVIRALSVPDAHHPRQRYRDGIQDLGTPWKNTAGHRERCDNVSGYNRHRWLNAPVCHLRHTHTHTKKVPAETWEWHTKACKHVAPSQVIRNLH